MGKRTRHKTGKTHAKRARDLWSTIDPRCIPPLLPHLPRGGRYAEPMAGEARLIRMLEPHIACAWAADLKPMAPGIEARDVFASQIGDADLYISNPPWTRKVLHQIIVHLSDQAPTWLLFDTDWLVTNQAGAFMERCRKVVYTGRLIWIEGTTNAGFQACAWYLFDKPITGSHPTFYGHECLPSDAARRTRRLCADCGVVIDRFGKWKLQTRNGLPTPVHRNCADPAGRLARAPADAPLLDWRAA